MKNITKKQKMIFIILAVIIIAGIAVISTIGFNLELKMQETKKIELYIQKDFEISDIKNIVKEVIPDESIMIQKVEVFEDSVSITAKDITDEQKQSIIDKVNEKYGTELKADSTEIINIPNMKIRDLVKPYVTSFAISTVLILVYIAIRYRKLGSIKTMINSLLMPESMIRIMTKIIKNEFYNDKNIYQNILVSIIKKVNELSQFLHTSRSLTESLYDRTNRYPLANRRIRAV